MIKSYIYHGEDDTRIDYDDRENVITLTKLKPQTLEVAKMIVKKHSIRVGDTIIQHSKAKNYIDIVKETIIDEGIRTGVCEVM